MTDHLTPIALTAELRHLFDRIRFLTPPKCKIVWLELHAFEETRTPHDAQRLARALRHVADLPRLAEDLETLIAGAQEAVQGDPAPGEGVTA